ncbi:DUF2637 domain-containing protein [Streptomyces scabiei]|uniref:DUF2637 domain-containing protein n=1 Tax=Streptomyces scabiei TaxID=1930 RepID=UPI0029A03F8B|nr:DUF2637 domain-containing protein [Streptomyces scabiei]MDX3114609.1 DUF2637 domain-containing protein [Streptomyces scabiei]
MRAQLARVDAVIVQAVIAGALSFSHLHDLADAAGQGGWKAWAYPVSVDLLLVAAWRRMREQQRAGQPAGGPRLWFLIALAASLGANVATAGLLDLDDVPASLCVVVAGWPAVAFFGGTLLAHTSRIVDSLPVAATPETDGEPAPVPAVVDAPDRDALPEPVAEPDPDTESPTTSAPVAAPAVTLPPALIDRAQALAEQHRATTGLVADPDDVRARLGLPPSMTASVAAHL